MRNSASPRRHTRWLGAFVAAAVAMGGAGGREILGLTPRVLAAPGRAGIQESSNDLVFTPPAGYVQERKGDVVVLVPATTDDRTPCVYGLAGRQMSTGNLETDAQAALVNAVVPGWRRLDNRFAAMRGTSAAGWPYVWYRASFEGDLGGQRQVVNAMAMVLPAGPGQVHVIWGLGSIARCLLDDVSFEQLFHSLRPPGWTSDAGRAVTRAIAGTWRYTTSVGLQQFTFTADGRYERGLGVELRLPGQTFTKVTTGRFTIQNGELALTADSGAADGARFHVRVFEEWFVNAWKPAITLFDSRATPPLVLQYYRVDP